MEVRLDVIRSNARVILDLCRGHGIEPAAVVKGFNAIPQIMDVLVGEGYRCLASSRIGHLAKARARGYPVATMGLRIPMRSELADVAQYCDVILNSDLGTVRLLDDEARRAGKVQKIVFMRDLGDLREGVFDSEQFVERAVFAAKDFANIELVGIGANLGCYGSVKPTVKNMQELARNASEIERATGRKLGMVSGGASTSLPMVARGQMPREINHLRVGAAIMHRREIYGIEEGELAELSDKSLVLSAEVIEAGEKPTHPVGERLLDCFGNVAVYEDRGVRRRVLLAIGAYDVGNCQKLDPLDEGVRILGCSSDHMIVDVHDSRREYRAGDVMSFGLMYQSMLFATSNDMIRKNFTR
jgi:predicted amino acid racemase